DYEELARKNHARFFVTGRMSTMRDSASVLLQLHDLEMKSDPVQLSKLAPVSEWWRAASSGVAELLPRIIPGGSRSLQKDWSDRNPQAIALFLAGEAAFRHLQRDSALTLFKEAVSADSTFGFAALRGAQAASWAHQFNDAKSLVHIALSHPQTERDRAFAQGLDAFLDGRADSSITALRAALAIDADMSVAWMQLSETYLHLLPSEGITDSLADDALAHAVALDSSNTGLIYHQVELAARADNRARVDLLANRFLTTASDTMLRGEVALVKACVDGAWTDSLLHDAATHRPQPLSIAAKLIGLSHPKCMRDGYAKLLLVDTSNAPVADGRRFFAIVGLQQALLAKGAVDSAIMEVDRFIARWKYGTSIFLIDAPVVPAFVERARQVATSDSSRLGADYHAVPSATRAWLLGTWAAFDGKLATAQAVAADLEKRAAKSGQQSDRVRVEALQAHIAMARHDTTDAIRRLQALLKLPALKDSVSWEEAGSLGLERLTLGRLLMARHEYASARDVLRVLDSAAPANFPLYAPLALQLRIDAATALGDEAEVQALRKRLRLMAS
ncbi:MAG: hypothetical protein M3Y64_03835, partial [Gemmatimonadota bacterium]|nr:hypothetical protein [Gemmatimonadota bacterium]